MNKKLYLMFITSIVVAQSYAQDQGSPASDAEVRRAHGEAFNLSADKVSKEATPYLKRVYFFIHKKNWYAAEANCRVAEEIFSKMPMLLQVAYDEKAQVYLAEGRYQDALNLWEPRFQKGQQPDRIIAADMMIAYAGLREPEKAAPLVEIIQQHEIGKGTGIDGEYLQVVGQNQPAGGGERGANDLRFRGRDHP